METVRLFGLRYGKYGLLLKRQAQIWGHLEAIGDDYDAGKPYIMKIIRKMLISACMRLRFPTIRARR